MENRLLIKKRDNFTVTTYFIPSIFLKIKKIYLVRLYCKHKNKEINKITLLNIVKCIPSRECDML